MVSLRQSSGAKNIWMEYQIEPSSPHLSGGGTSHLRRSNDTYYNHLYNILHRQLPCPVTSAADEKDEPTLLFLLLSVIAAVLLPPLSPLLLSTPVVPIFLSI